MTGEAPPAQTWIGESLTPDDVWNHRIRKTLVHCQTPFQELYVVESGAYGKALVLDEKWQTCTGDEFLYHEPLVHGPAVLHGQPRRVLIAGGADGGTAREVLRWNSIEDVVVADIDGAAVDACRTWLPEIHQGAFDDPRVTLHIGDAYEFIADTRGWDLIIADLTDPIEEGPAFKLFTREFFTLCERALAPHGVFINQAGSLSPPLLTPFARTMNTIASVFPQTAVLQANVPTYGSPWGFVVARREPIDTSPDPRATDDLLARQTTGGLRMFDGRAFLAMLNPPRYVRDRVAAETRIYSLDQPPQLRR